MSEGDAQCAGCSELREVQPAFGTAEGERDGAWFEGIRRGEPEVAENAHRRLQSFDREDEDYLRALTPRGLDARPTASLASPCRL